jgi:membrane protein required for colicin V production
MNGIDWLILIMMGIGILTGVMQGFVKQLASLVGLVAGLLVARALFGVAGEWLAPEIGTSVTVAQIIAFVLIWVLVPLGFTIAAAILSRALSVVHLGWVNRWLGSGLGLLKYLMIVGLFIHAIEYIDPHSQLVNAEKKQGSVFYEPVRSLTSALFPVFKHAGEQLKDL